MRETAACRRLCRFAVRNGSEGVKKLNFNISPSFCFNKLAGVKWPIFQFFHSLSAFPRGA
jgi:hypothetical protein